MRRLAIAIGIPALASLGLALSSGQVMAAAPPAATATYTISYTCTSGCPAGPYVHMYNFSIDCTGALTGTGVEVGAAGITESVTGQMSVDRTTQTISINFTSVYTGLFLGYVLIATGTVDPSTGALTGTATASGGGIDPQAFVVNGVRNNFSFNPSSCSGPVGDNEDEDGWDDGGD